MRESQISSIAACWKTTEEEVRRIIEQNGGLEKATFKKVDGHFKDLDWQRRKAEWNAFRGISIKFSTKKLLVADGLDSILKGFFAQDDIHHPLGWDSALSINNYFVTFSQVRVYNAKSCASRVWYMYIKVHGTREEMTSGTMNFDANTIHIIPWDAMTKPIQEPGQPKLRFMDYLKEMACTSFTQAQMDQWTKEKKFRAYSGNLRKEEWR